MNEFLIDQLSETPSELDQAQIERWQLQSGQQQDDRLVTLQYDRLGFKRRAVLAGLKSLNLFDYCQRVGKYIGPKARLDDLQFDNLSKQPGNGNVISFANEHQRVVARVTLLSAGIADEADQIDQIAYFDQHDRLVRSIYYDSRGFKSLEVTYGQDGGVALEQFFDTDGAVRLTFGYHREGEQIEIALIRLQNRDGQWQVFQQFHQLVAYFFDTLNQRGHHRFIANSVVQLSALADMHTPAEKFMMLDQMQTNDYRRLQSGQPTQAFQQLLAVIPADMPLVAATAQQAADIADRWPELTVKAVTPIMPIPEPSAKLQGQRLIMNAAITPVNRLEDGIKAFRRVYRELPTATLTIYGTVVDHQLFSQLQTLVNTSGLSEAVTFKTDATKIEEITRNADLFLLTSHYEVYPTAMAEIMAAGVPVIAYEINYGVSTLIEDGVEGRLVATGDSKQLAQTTIDILQNDALRQKMGVAARSKIERINQQIAVPEWAELLK